MDKQWHGNDRKWTPWKEVQNPGSIYSTDIYIYKCISNHKITLLLRRKANKRPNPLENNCQYSDK